MLYVYHFCNDPLPRSAGSKHAFSTNMTNWGFSVFLPLEELRDPARGFLVNDTIKVSPAWRVAYVYGCVHTYG
jgi:hypothetical protein